MKQKAIAPIFHPSTIGMIGAGQLGKMIAVEAKRMGYRVIVLDPTPNAPAAQVADRQIIANFDDVDAVHTLAQLSDVITYEFEHIHTALLKELEEKGHRVYPSANTLQIIQNKYTQKKLLREHQIKVPRFFSVTSLEELKEHFYLLGERAILKTCEGGYDGKGNLVIRSLHELELAYEQWKGRPLMIEEFIDIRKEVSLVVARNSSEMVHYPISENYHNNSILIKSLIPASIPEKVEKEIRSISKEIVQIFDDYGVFCIEFFIDDNYEVLVNEIAPRPHNTGHYTIEGCICSQFEQLVRVICGMPLGSPKLNMPCVLYNILGNEDVMGHYTVKGLDSVLTMTDCHFHLYGKANTMPMKKLGHLTVLGQSLEAAEAKAQAAISQLKIERGRESHIS